MANISSFSGSVYFMTNKNPWTPDGYLYAYDVLGSIDACGGDYGICMSEDEASDSAEFLSAVLDTESIMYWGTGRWSAQNVFDMFNSWTQTKHSTQPMTQETYETTRQKLLQLMYDNGWYFQFEYVDEEGGVGFIVAQQVVISVVQDPSTKELEFTTSTTTSDNEDYTLDAYCRLVEEEENIIQCQIFNETVQEIVSLMNINEGNVSKFIEFLIEKEYHFKLPPYGYYDSLEDLPEGIIEKWKEYYNEHIKE